MTISHQHSAAELWRSYDDCITARQITDDYGLKPYYAKQTPDEHLAIGIVDRQSALPCNVMVATATGRHRFLHPVTGGQHAPCSSYIDVTQVIVAESYLSGLALAVRYPDRYVAAALVPENIEPCIRLIESWWWVWVSITVAPDDPANRYDGVVTLRPPNPKLTWAELHKWEVGQCAVA